MSTNRHVVMISIVLAFIPTFILAQGSNDQIIQGIKAFSELDWEKSIMSFNNALQLGLSEKAQIEAYKYLGFCYIETGEQKKAKDTFKCLLYLNPNYELDPNTRQIYIEVFNKVKSEFGLSGEKLLKDGTDVYDKFETKKDIKPSKISDSQTEVDESEHQFIHGGQFKYNTHVSGRLKLASLSLFMPGLGQYIGNRYISGTVFLLMGLGTAAGAAIGYLQYDRSVDAYNQTIASYHDAVTADAVSENEKKMIAAHDDADKKFSIRRVGFIVAGSVWALNLLHILLAGASDSHILSQTQSLGWNFAPQVTPNTVELVAMSQF